MSISLQPDFGVELREAVREHLRAENPGHLPDEIDALIEDFLRRAQAPTIVWDYETGEAELVVTL